MTEAQLYAYERFWMAVFDEQALRETRYNQGRTEGAQEKALDAARRMKADGMSEELIVRYTGLAPEAIKKL